MSYRLGGGGGGGGIPAGHAPRPLVFRVFIVKQFPCLESENGTTQGSQGP